MKSFIKAATICSLLIVASLLIASCGTEQFVQGKGNIIISAKDAANTPITNAKVEVSQTAGGTYNLAGYTSTPGGTYTYTNTVGTYYFKVTSGALSKSDVPATINLTTDTALDVKLP